MRFFVNGRTMQCSGEPRTGSLMSVFSSSHCSAVRTLGVSMGLVAVVLMFHYSITLYSRHHSSQMAHAVIKRHSGALCATFELDM